MKDVAGQASVALKTVSRYVNGETNIDLVLAERIRAAIEDLGYRRNLSAASIRPGWSNRTIGLIISDLSNPYYSTLARAIEGVAADRDYILITSSSEEDGARFDRLVDRLMEQQVDAVVAVPPREQCRPWGLVAPPLPPIVFIDRPVDFEHADNVVADNSGGGEAATTALAEAGSRRIAFVGDALSIYTMQERHVGYRRGLAQAGRQVDEGLEHTSAHTLRDAAEIVGRIISSGSADAIFAANNRASIGALYAFREAGRRLPLVGFDDFEAAPLASPSVSVVSQDIELMGRTAAEIALARLGGDDSQRSTRVLPTRLVLRGSERP